MTAANKPSSRAKAGPLKDQEACSVATGLNELDSSPSLLLALLGQTAMRRLRAAHVAHGLNPRQLQVLALLNDRLAMSQGELGQVLRIDSSILVTLLNPLEASGYIARKRDPEDRRCHVVTLTRAGVRHLERAIEVQRVVESELFAGLTIEQLEQLRTLLLSVRAGLETHEESACSAIAADESC